MYRPTSPVANWERLVVAATTSTARPAPPPGFRRLGSELPDSVPQSVKVQAANIDTILQVANDVEQDDPNVARILCEHAYQLCQSLDPNSEGRGVLQFKAGLKSVIMQKLPNSKVFQRSQDIASIQNFYKAYREKHRQEDERMRFGVGVDPNERTAKKKKVFTTLRILKEVVDALAGKIPSTEIDKLITLEFKKEMELDVEVSEKFKTYNILPLEASLDTYLVVEVKAAIIALEYLDSGLPQLPRAIENPKHRNLDLFDALHYAFGFQRDNVSNQREHLVLLLANAQSQLGSIEETESQIHEEAINKLCNKILDNYLKWCDYIRQRSAYHHQRVTTKKWKLLLVSLYLLIWGEAANVRFLPECICYIFHRMASELLDMGDEIHQARSCRTGTGSSFLDQIISPVYYALKEEADKNNGGKAAHSKWRNYDDFNELFWSPSCFKEFDWPWKLKEELSGKPKRIKYPSGKTSFVEHRSFLHLYRSFHRVWILLIMMFQGLTIIAFSSKLDLQTLKIALSLGPTYFVMNLVESVLDILLMFRAYKSSRSNAVARIFLRFLFFGACAVGFFYLYLRMMQESNGALSNSLFFKVYLLALGTYVVLHLLVSLIMHIPSLRLLGEKWDHFKVVQLMNWIYQDRYFVGRGLFERPRDYIRYVLFWWVVLGCKFTFSYFLQIKPLVNATSAIISAQKIKYRWHDFVSQNNHNALAVGLFWAPVVMIYLLDISIWYTVFSAVLGSLIGARDRLGEIHSLEMLRNRFESFPKAFVDTLQKNRLTLVATGTTHEVKAKGDAGVFAPFWNEIVQCLRSEDYITNREKELLVMPSNKGALKFVQWPLFLLVGKVFLAMDLAVDEKNVSTKELWGKLAKDEYMVFAVKEAYESLVNLLASVTDSGGKSWVNDVGELERKMKEGSFDQIFQIDKLRNLPSKITALTGLLVQDRTDELEKGARQALQDLYNAVTQDLFLREDDKLLVTHGQLIWPSTTEEKESVKRLHSLLTIKESPASIPKNLEARRRLEFFTNSLFMKKPKTPTVTEMKSFSVYTPYYEEIVLYSNKDLRKENEDGISTLFYLQKIFPDEWNNFLERIGPSHEERISTGDLETPQLLELRLWASYRGQTLARTVRGMMYYRRALMLQSYLEDIKRGPQALSFEYSSHARAYADMKFTYVVTCQKYGEQRKKSDTRAVDILYLMKRNAGLRIAFIDIIQSQYGGKAQYEYYSKLVKADNGMDEDIYSIKLPGNPILGEGKPENQNHAIIFTRGDAIQTIDMNQDNYFEEALKMRNLLQEFREDHGLRLPTILGVREHVFTGSVSSLAWFMSNQETSFVTLGQRVLANPLKVRMHYGHPDVFDRIFHLTRGGISKASKEINISEDIFAGFNSTLRQGNITHHEYIQADLWSLLGAHFWCQICQVNLVGKGRDVGLNQIAAFEAKVSGGNGEQALSRDVYRLGQAFDFFRMLSFYTTSVGYYVCTMMTVLVVYVFLYGKAYLALSGVGAFLEKLALITSNKALQSVLETQFLFQIGMFTAVPMLLGFILEQGVWKAIISSITMQLQLCSVFFTFSLGTRGHYFGRTILHGGAKYRATGRGFVLQHIKFAENYRLYSRSHFVKALEIVMLLLVYLAYGFDNSSISYILLSFSSWFLAISWLSAPFIFNPSGFEWQKTVDDFENWITWLLYGSGVGVKEEESWETWWEAEQEHIRTLRGRILETVLSLRFFIFQYGVVYHLQAAQGNTNLAVYGISWLVLVGVVLIFQVFSFGKKAFVNYQMLIRLVQAMFFIIIVATLIATVSLTALSVGDVFASLLALIPTGWGILSIGIAWQNQVKPLGLWNTFRAIARFYDAAMGMVIFFPIAILSWFPFVSTFQTRLLFNQAFSRGLEISLILAGNRPNIQA